MNKLEKISVLGAGVMGSQIALELARYGYTVFLFDKNTQLSESGKQKVFDSISAKELINSLPSKEIYKKALENIYTCNYDNDLHKISNCNLIIEAIIEQTKVKQELYTLVKPYINANAVLATNTSGLSITELSNFSHNHELFCGLHFFNPPRHLALVEYIKSSPDNNKCDWVIEELMHNNVHFKFLNVKNSPNFIGNRIGFFAWLVAVHSSIEFNLPIEIADALSGELIGRSKSATYRTADIVGLDVVKHVLETLHTINDERFKKWYKIPEILNILISNNFLGQKSKKGFYTKDTENNILVLSSKNDMGYNKILDINKEIHQETFQILKKNISLSNKIVQLKDINHINAKFVIQIVSIVREYIEYHNNTIAYNKSDIEVAMKYGFGWNEI